MNYEGLCSYKHIGIQQFGQSSDMEKVKTQSLKPQVSRSFDPKGEFIEACLYKGGPFSYSELFLQSLELKQFPTAEEEIKFKAYAIANQIGLISRGQSTSQELQQIITERHGIVRQLRNQLTNSMQSRQLNLTSVCLKMESIRIYSLMIIQKIQVLVQKLKIFRCSYFTQIVQRINQDIDFLKYGPMKKYIEFSRVRDPLLMVPLRKFNFNEGNLRKPLVNLFQIEPDLLKRLQAAEITLKNISSDSDQYVELRRNDESLTGIRSEASRSKHTDNQGDDRQKKLKQLVKKLKGPQRQELSQIIDEKKKRDMRENAKQSTIHNKQMKNINNSLQPSPIRYKDQQTDDEIMYRYHKEANTTKLPSLLSNNMRINLKSINKSIQTNPIYQNREKRLNSIDANAQNSQTRRKISIRSSSNRNSESEVSQLRDSYHENSKRKQSFRRSVSRSPRQNKQRNDRDIKSIKQYIDKQEENKTKTLRNMNKIDSGLRQYKRQSMLSSNYNKPNLQKLHERDQAHKQKSSYRNNNLIYKNNFRSINPIIQNQDGILSIMPFSTASKIPISIVRQKQINIIGQNQLRNIMEGEVSEIKIYLKPFYEDSLIDEQDNTKQIEKFQEKNVQMNSTLKRVPTLILFHDSDSDSSSGQSNNLNHMDHPEMMLAGSQHSLSLIAKDSREEESSFDFNRIQSPISDIFSRKSSPIMKLPNYSFSQNHRTLNPFIEAKSQDKKQQQKMKKQKASHILNKDVDINSVIKDKQGLIQPLSQQNSKEPIVTNSNLNVAESDKSFKIDQSSSNNLNSSLLSEDQKISLLKNCAFKSKSLSIKELSKIIVKINSEKAEALISMLSSGYMAHRHINIISCLWNNQIVSYCLVHPQLAPKVRLLYILHLQVVHKKFKSVEVQMVNQFIKFIFGSDPCHYIVTLRMKDFSIEDIQYYKKLRFFVKIIDRPAYLTQFNVKALLLERKGLKCQKKEDYVNVFNSLFITVLPVNRDILSISELPSNFDAKIQDRLGEELNQHLNSSIGTNFLNWSQVAKYLKDQDLPTLKQIQVEGSFKMAMFSLQDCMLKTQFIVHSKQFYFYIDPPLSMIYQTKNAYFMILSTANSKRYCIFGDKLYEQDDNVDVLKQFKENVQGQSFSYILTRSQEKSKGKIVTCPEFKAEIKSSSQNGSMALNTELVWKQYIKGVRKPNEEDVYLQLVTPFFWGVAELDQDNRFQLLISANIEETELIK